ncbi:hypothetical protein H4O18_03270 [Arenibacter sp. BSSL-BM3]|uniref:Lipocalin-like domain-containing protein n=1 Tax=Arenibacter arenosicollis TaxID=2762274 RepID=A0ABR7QIP2_9FLAO|nr:hypothetical protein [Arenibacter arenosicollis]MBC8767004.1 hypothetical protein [Arenibacter arenosicollis]
MGNFKGIIKIGFLVCTMLMGFSAMANADVNQLDVGVVNDANPFGEENFIGNWKYSAENVPYEYARGILFISKKEGSLKVLVALPGGERKADDVKVKDNTLTFSLNLEGQLVSVSITVEGDKISGKASSEDGIFKLSGERRLDPE